MYGEEAYVLTWGGLDSSQEAIGNPASDGRLRVKKSAEAILLRKEEGLNEKGLQNLLRIREKCKESRIARKRTCCLR